MSLFMKKNFDTHYSLTLIIKYIDYLYHKITYNLHDITLKLENKGEKLPLDYDIFSKKSDHNRFSLLLTFMLVVHF